MTLYDVVALGGIVLSLTSLAVIISLWPFSRRPACCLKARPDAACAPACLRVCHLRSAA